jgi:hypothetical protein
VNPLATRPALRRKVYGLFWAVGLGLGSAQVAVDGSPDWLTKALAVYAFLGTAVGYTAQRNVSPE